MENEDNKAVGGIFFFQNQKTTRISGTWSLISACARAHNRRPHIPTLLHLQSTSVWGSVATPQEHAYTRARSLLETKQKNRKANRKRKPPSRNEQLIVMHYYPGYSQCRSGSSDLGLTHRRSSTRMRLQQEQEPTDSGESTLSELDGTSNCEHQNLRCHLSCDQ